MFSVLPGIPEQDSARNELAKYSDRIKHLLYHRGIKTAKEAQHFLDPVYEHNHDPMLMSGMKKATERFLHSIDTNEHIVIYSDYDADGIPGAVVLASFLKRIGYTNFSHYIPDRHLEGFGVNMGAIDEIIYRAKIHEIPHTFLLITIDCGISDVEPIQKAKDLGIDVIITDHHMPGSIFPAAYAIVNPKISIQEQQVSPKKAKNTEELIYPFNMLSGSGVIFKFVQGLMLLRDFSDKGFKPGHEKWLLDMVGIATMSDMVPLIGENRIFAHFGLKVLRKSPRIGLQTLLSKQKIDQRYINEEDIGFSISPRINAASRMGKADKALELFLTDDESKALELSIYLQKLNDERKGYVAAIVKDLKKHLEDDLLASDNSDIPKCIIVKGNPDWRPSLLGLAANSLIEQYKCPVFLWGRGEGGTIIKGSCRTYVTEGMNGHMSLVNLMHKAEEIYSTEQIKKIKKIDKEKIEEIKKLFLHCGGHAMSGGFAVDHEHIHLLPEYLEKAVKFYAKDFLNEKNNISNVLKADLELTLDEIDMRLYNEISQLAPFGVGNQKPLLLIRNVIPQEVRQFGKAKEHFEMSARNGKGRTIKMLCFFAKPEDFHVVPDVLKPVSIVGHIEHSRFLGKSEIRLRLVEVF